MAPDSSSRIADVTIPALPVKTESSVTAANDQRNEPTGLQRSSNDSSVRELNMKSEADRFKTFDRWPVPFMDPTLMAAAGFFYTNRSDTVQCAFCNVQVGRWEEGDDPFADHKRWGPSCPYLRRLFVGNIPRGGTPAISPSLNAAYDVCGPYGLELRPNAVNENASQPIPSSQERHGIIEACGPVYAARGSMAARLKSFKTWPKCIKQRPDSLSEAGFFYSGRGDQTFCFHCGGGLKDWQEGDDPWVEHAKWFPKCMFLILNKGKDFVEEVLRTKTSVMPAEAARDISAPGERAVSTGEVLPLEESLETTSASCEKANEEKPNDSNNEHLLCKICFAEERGVLFLPCGHLVACVKCAPVLSTCAVCRRPVSATVRAFIP